MAAARPLPVEIEAPGLFAPAVPSASQLALVEREALRTARDVEQLSAPALRAIAPILQQAQRETALGLRRWLANVHDGDLRYTAQHHRALLVHLDRAFATIRQVQPTLANALGIGSTAAGRMAVHHLTGEFARLSRVFTGAEQHLQVNLLRILATSDRYLIPRVRTSAARYAGKVGDDIRRELAVGLIRGETISALTDRLARLRGPRGIVAIRGIADEGGVTEDIAEGLFRRYRSWGSRVARTELQNAYNVQKDEGYREALEHVPDLKRRWDASLDLRVCVVCAELHGAIAAVDTNFQPGDVPGPPRHPNCRCVTVPWREAWTKPTTAPASTSTSTPSEPSSNEPPSGGETGPPTATLPSGFNPIPLRNALNAPTINVGVFEYRSAADQAVIRREVRSIVDRLGMVDRDATREARDRIRTLPLVHLKDAWGLHAGTGEIWIDREVDRRSRSFFAKLATGARPSEVETARTRTLIHETVHGYSPLGHASYAGAGRVVEEVTVELTARRLMRETFSLSYGAIARPIASPQSSRSYDREIVAVRRRVQALFGIGPRAAIEVLEETAVTMRRAGPIVNGPVAYTRHFANSVAVPEPALKGLTGEARTARIRALRDELVSGLIEEFGS